MRAVVVRSYGGPQVLEVVETPVPEPGDGQVRIRVEAAAANPVDLATRSGDLVAAGLMAPRPVTGIGWDVAGVVDAAGPGAGGFTPGDRVIGLRDRLDASLGTYAEYVVLDASAVAPAPSGTPAAQAATLPLAALTALQALDLLALEAGGTLLVTGAAGAVGGFAVQLAALRGLHVAAMAGDGDAEYVRSLGARWFVGRSQDDPAERTRTLVPGGVDGALDAAALGVRVLGAVRNRGAFAALAPGAAPIPLRGIRVVDQWIAADGKALTGLARLVEEGRLRPPATETFPLEQAAHVHERLAKGGLRGRLVLTPRAS